MAPILVADCRYDAGIPLNLVYLTVLASPRGAAAPLPTIDVFQPSPMMTARCVLAMEVRMSACRAGGG